MECGTCASTHRKFWCSSCISERLQNHVSNYTVLAVERDSLAERIHTILGSNRPPTGISPAEEAEAAKGRIKAVESSIAAAREAVQKGREELKTVRRTINQRRQILAQAHATLEHERLRSIGNIRQEVDHGRGKYRQAAEVLMQSRRLLVREVVSIFRLRKVQRKQGKEAIGGGVMSSAISTYSVRNGTSSSLVSSGVTTTQSLPIARTSTSALLSSSPDVPEYRIINVGFPIFGYSLSSPHERFNAGLGYVIHMTILLSHYLHVTLPFQIVNKGARSFAQAAYVDSSSEFSHLPLYLSDNNVEAFTVGLSMLNYNIAYLCYTQGVDIPIYQVHNTLENLALCCQAPDLGCDVSRPRRDSPHGPQSTTASYPSPREPFSLDFQKVVRLHIAIRTRRWVVSEIAALRNDGEPKSEYTISPSLRQILEENSEDEDETVSGWHLVDEPLPPHV
ncbi:uncharacterized protein SPPG_05972 [Spizellomyces punctatus DAOM BR117]|uniref:Autophagy-related protein 14 n=1 Tax=Spizellomyces punctatus (strain DAOM BR117) TaxID=645134 RepID=A0A0L0HD06_SPIPD|nr:uncharacterized protein SPPG_05972 [Spizellomyces punctatus DAOM BR117]KNC99022.1 hypothetical protein SPPG_05972 [Spizellomyces punctatus DAOM BR117]|eukprot:XP_016607062.1 hypothetical protein SPPG_05972 [Spizellomyces punctatus DAOM BR117]